MKYNKKIIYTILLLIFVLFQIGWIYFDRILIAKYSYPEEDYTFDSQYPFYKTEIKIYLDKLEKKVDQKIYKKLVIFSYQNQIKIEFNKLLELGIAKNILSTNEVIQMYFSGYNARLLNDANKLNFVSIKLTDNTVKNEFIKIYCIEKNKNDKSQDIKTILKNNNVSDENIESNCIKNNNYQLIYPYYNNDNKFIRVIN